MTAPASPPMRTRRIITVPPRPSPANDDVARGPRPLPLLDADDLGWVAELTDAVARFEGQPWRVALDAIEGGTWRADSADESISPRRLTAATTALRRLLAGRPRDAYLARKARSLLLGVPALDEVARASRVARVAEVLELTPVALDRVLWADVPRERPIELARGRPSASEVAAHANVGLLQRALARARSLELVILGDASPILRGSAARGLIVSASERIVGEDIRQTVLDITGPLALCHSTAVYGRALGYLVQLLASCEAFEMTIRAEARGQQYELRVESPALLPAITPQPWALVERLAKDLERLGGPSGVRVRRLPPVLAQRATVGSAHGNRGGPIVCPDLGIEVGDRVVWLEVVGFWTPEYLARKLARYRAVGASDVVLCVDASRACDDDDPPRGACVVRYTRRVHAEVLLQLLGAG